MSQPNSPDDDFVLDEFLPYQLAVLAGRVSREFSAIYREKFGFGVSEWRVLAHLSQTGSVSVREIHEKVDMDKSKVSRAATRLEKSGYLTKQTNAEDRRLIELALTTKGCDVVKQLTPLAQEFERKVLAQLGDFSGDFRKSVDALLADETTQR